MEPSAQNPEHSEAPDQHPPQQDSLRKSLQMQPRMSASRNATANDSEMDCDIQAIKDVLYVHHVPVVASLQWEKLQIILSTLCDRLTLQAVRLERVEEQGNSFLSFKDDLTNLVNQSMEEMKKESQTEVNDQKKWSEAIEERLKALQQGVEENTSSMKQMGENVEGIQTRVGSIETTTTTLKAQEEARSAADSVLNKQSESLENLTQKIDLLNVDFEEQNEKLHQLEHETEQLKLKLEQATNKFSTDIDDIQQYCKNLRSDFEMKFLVNAESVHSQEPEMSSAAQSKLEAAVAELQNRIQKKADTDIIEKISQSNQTVKETCEKLESSMVELQSQLKRVESGSRRASRISFSGKLPLGNQIPMSLPEPKPLSKGDLSPELVDELTKDMKESIQTHSKEIENIHREFGMLGRSILKMSGHQEDKLDTTVADRAQKLMKLVEKITEIDAKPADPTVTVTVPAAIDSQPDARTLEQMDNIAIMQEINDCLKSNKFEAKENVKIFSRLSDELLKMASKLQEVNTVLPTLQDSVNQKSDKRDLQKLARFVKEQLERPENAIFTGKPLSGFKCMSCEHNLDKLSRVPGDRGFCNRMPPQILPMLSAERIYSHDKRGNAHVSQSPQKGWSSTSLPNSGLPSGDNGPVVTARGKRAAPKRTA